MMTSYRKRVVGTIISAVLLISAAVPAAFAAPGINTSDDIYTENVHKAFMAGYDTGAFGANDYMLRADAAQIIYNLINDGSAAYAGAAPTFTDMTDSGKYYYYPIGYLQSVGILSGYGDGAFKPEAYITRTELLAMLDCYLQCGAFGQCNFSDVDKGYWGYSFIMNAAASGWVIGDSGAGGLFRPEDNITRAEATAVFVQALERNDSYVPDAGTGIAFPDVNDGDWFYNLVMEATNTHSAYDNVYASILTRYRRAFSSDYQIYDGSTVSAGILNSGYDSEKDNPYYAYVDLGNDGVTELIIAGGTEDRKAIFDIYTYGADRQPIRLFELHTDDRYFGFGERVNVVFEDDGTIVITGSSSAFQRNRSYYRISNDGKPERIEEVWFIGSDEGMKYYRTDENGTTTEISEAAYDAVLASYPVSADHSRGVSGLEWIPITE